MIAGLKGLYEENKKINIVTTGLKMMGIDIIKFSILLLYALTVCHIMNFCEKKLFPSFGFFIPAYFL